MRKQEKKEGKVNVIWDPEKPVLIVCIGNMDSKEAYEWAIKRVGGFHEIEVGIEESPHLGWRLVPKYPHRKETGDFLREQVMSLWRAAGRPVDQKKIQRALLRMERRFNVFTGHRPAFQG